MNKKTIYYGLIIGLVSTIAIQNPGYAIENEGTPAQDDLSLALIRACKDTSIEMVKALLSEGANPNALVDSVTPLNALMQKIRYVQTLTNEEMELFHLLLDKGADIHSPGAPSTAIEILLNSSLFPQGVAKELLQRGARVNRALKSVLTSKATEESKKNFTRFLKRNETLLHPADWAAFYLVMQSSEREDFPFYAPYKAIFFKSMKDLVRVISYAFSPEETSLPQWIYSAGDRNLPFDDYSTEDLQKHFEQYAEHIRGKLSAKTTHSISDEDLKKAIQTQAYVMRDMKKFFFTREFDQAVVQLLKSAH